MCTLVNTLIQGELSKEEEKRSSQEVAADIEKMAKEMADLKKKLQLEKIIKDETIKKLEQVGRFFSWKFRGFAFFLWSNICVGFVNQ